MFNHKNTPSYFLKNSKVLSSNSELVSKQRHGDVTIHDKSSSPAARVRSVTKHLSSPSGTTQPKIRISPSSSQSPRESCDKNTEKTSGSISANVGGGGIPRDTEQVTSQTVTQIPIQIKQNTKSTPPLTSAEVEEEKMITREGGNTTFDSGQEYKSVSVSTHWSWDDIFHTVNTTDEEGRHKYKFYPSPTKQI